VSDRVSRPFMILSAKLMVFGRATDLRDVVGCGKTVSSCSLSTCTSLSLVVVRHFATSVEASFVLTARELSGVLAGGLLPG
jgi:hypothetical protein